MEKEIKLPKPKERGLMSVEETFNRRTSIRDYKHGALGLQQVSQVLWAACGKNLHRYTAPSAGATYPLETYLVVGEVEGLEPGTYHYSPSSHSLEKTNDQDIRNRLSRAALGQRMIERAPINVVIAAVYGRTTGRMARGAFGMCTWRRAMWGRMYPSKQMLWAWAR